MKNYQILPFLIFLFSSISIIVNGHICAEYKQEISSNNRIDASKNPSFVVYPSECKGCVATIEKGNFQTFCDMGSDLCETTKALNCNHKSCCCRGMFCYDQLRSHFASAPSPSSTECIVQRKSQTTNEPESESDNGETSYSRNTCSICVAEFHGNAIESRCVDSENLHSECLFATELIGEHLACTKDRKKCCCRSNNCQKQFEKLFFENGENLGQSFISEPYVSPTLELKDSAAPNLHNFSFAEALILLFFTNLLLL
uniref:Uncharacterized protein n=1 Tax=Panagrolaimus superbus TaxID=310955 RepID=A0A914ZGL7_9BILA